MPTRIDRAQVLRVEAREHAPYGTTALGAVLQVQSELEFEGRALDALQPETVTRLDMVLAALLDGGITENELRVILRHALVRPVN